MTSGVAATRRARSALGALAIVLAGGLVATACSSADLQEGGIPTTTVPARTEAPAGELPQRVRDELQAAVDDSMEQYGTPGVVVGVFVPGEGSWVSATGVADTATGELPSGEMAWPVRSITKSFTVTLIMQLVVEGRLSLDDTVDRYVDGVPNGDRITIRELADMSSGLADYTTEAFIDDFVADPERRFSLDELNAYAFAEPPQFEPGTRFVYTNTNTNVLGSVVESVTGMTYSQVLSERILDPLGLVDTAYLADGATWPEPHATGYQPVDGVLDDQPTNFSIFGPAGAMVSTLDDQRVWGEVLAEGSLLTAAAQADRLAGHELDKGPEYDQYALGIGELDGWWGHTGEGFGFTALTMHDPDSGATVVIFMNIAQPGDGTHPPTKLFREIAPIVGSIA
jgi:D-alanyl-D-alanine carboxypeptidase